MTTLSQLLLGAGAVALVLAAAVPDGKPPTHQGVR